MWYFFLPALSVMWRWRSLGFIRCRRVKEIALITGPPLRRGAPTSMVLPFLTACSTGRFHGARTHRLTVLPLQVTHCLLLPSPPPGFAASQGTDRNGGGSWLFFDPRLSSQCEQNLSFSSLIDLKDNSLSPLPTGTPGLIFSLGLEFCKFDFGLCSLLCKNSWVNIMLKGLTIRSEKREAGACRSQNTFVSQNLPCHHLVREEVWDEAEKQMRIFLERYWNARLRVLDFILQVVGNDGSLLWMFWNWYAGFVEALRL